MKKQYRIGVIEFFLIVSLLSMSSVQPVQSATFPERAITVVVPYAAGGRTDLTIRFVAQFMKDYLGQPMVVENKPGASSVLGTVQVVNAKPDGYTLLAGSAPLITASYTVETPITYKDLAPIGRITYDPAILVINPNKLKVKDLKEFVAYAKKNPKEIMVAVDPGQSNELHALAFAKAAGLEFRYVPYKGGGERIVALSGGHVDAMFDVPVTVKSMVEAGKAKIIGIATEGRFSAMKEIETFKEVGIDLVLGSWVGLLAHKKTPQAILKRLATDLEKTTKNPDFLKTLTNADTYLGYLPPEDFTKFLAEEDRFTKRMCEALGIKPQKMP